MVRQRLFSIVAVALLSTVCLLSYAIAPPDWRSVIQIEASPIAAIIAAVLFSIIAFEAPVSRFAVRLYALRRLAHLKAGDFGEAEASQVSI